MALTGSHWERGGDRKSPFRGVAARIWALVSPQEWLWGGTAHFVRAKGREEGFGGEVWWWRLEEVVSRLRRKVVPAGL